MARRFVGVGLMPIAVVFCVASGCGEGRPPVEVVTGLHFTTTSEFPNNPEQPVNVDVTLTDPMRSAAIYSATLALPEGIDGPTHCPTDQGVRHPVDFTDAEARVLLTAVLNPGGCQEVLIMGMRARSADEGYWTSVAQNLGVERSTLYAVTAP